MKDASFRSFESRVAGRRLLLLTATALGFGIAAARPLPALADNAWPSRPITMVVPYPAGGVVDVVARAVSAEMAKALKQSIVVVNKPGGNGNIAAETVARSAPDGYTLLVSAPFLVTNPFLESGLRWQPSDFTPVALMARSSDYLVVPADSPHGSVKAYVEAARLASQPLQYGIAGKGTPQALSVEVLKRSAGIALQVVPYQGAPHVINDLVSSRITMAVLPAFVASPQIKAGKLKALATMSDRRTGEWAQIPTITEAGYPEPTVFSWYGLQAPSATPKAVIARLSDAVRSAFAVAATRDKLTNALTEPAFMDVAEFTAFVQKETARWDRVTRQLSLN
ncbi:MAG: tripartite tricarboxylate transporter substrate binding protein [Burkholderiaceae bacterium]